MKLYFLSLFCTFKSSNNSFSFTLFYQILMNGFHLCIILNLWMKVVQPDQICLLYLLIFTPPPPMT